MPWVEVFAVLLVCHLVGDFLLQTDWQARNKRGGLGPNRESRRALASHVVVYTLAFIPAFIWLWDSLGAGVLGIAVLVMFPHWVQDDGRLLSAYMRTVKRADSENGNGILIAVDQSFHVAMLFGIALVAAS